jgi:coproporphyrinogen III oxidase-like Fe-S oxidoreductase
MFITHAMRILLGRQLGPFKFIKDVGFLPDLDVPALGLYIHIPFCRDLCPFCPYYKVKSSTHLFKPFLDALLSEITLVSNKIGRNGSKRKVTSLYFGGGSPALMKSDLQKIRKTIDDYFHVGDRAGIELHPRDVTRDLPSILKDSGFDMVSVGMQSFQDHLLSNIGREPVDYRNIFAALRRERFDAVDVDLIFGIPGQTEADLRADFLKAVDLGATQISTYPFIDFSFANNHQKPLGRTKQKKMLSLLLKTAEDAGFARTSVWTFGRKKAPRYSSITRENFLGFGPSATSLGRDAFKANTFSLEAYAESVNKGIVPTALKMKFSARSRKLYWLFWSCYTGKLPRDEYWTLFSSDLDEDFSFWLILGKLLGLFTETGAGFVLTDLGNYHFHWLEQEYTHQYIDKTWRSALQTPWPEKIAVY